MMNPIHSLNCPTLCASQLRRGLMALFVIALVLPSLCRGQTDTDNNADGPPKSNPASKGNRGKNEPGKGKPQGRDTKGKSKADPKDAIPEDPNASIQFSAPRVLSMQFGMRFYANDNICNQLHATIPFPMDWPEQKVTIVTSQIPTNAVWNFRDLPAGARQLVMDIPNLGARSELALLVDVDVEKLFIEPPIDPSGLVIPNPKKLSKEMNWYMGNSPYIEADFSDVKKIARSILESKPENAWAHVEKIYDWVRDNIEYKNGELKQIREALKTKSGDCEEMTGIFVAICRASNIPARCVWVPDHCYPEFYLEDANGKGHWYPCQVAGDKQFGQMHDYRPILQKGDRFRVPEEKAMQRYVAETFSCLPRKIGPIDPKVEPVRDLGPLQQELDALKR